MEGEKNVAGCLFKKTDFALGRGSFAAASGEESTSTSSSRLMLTQTTNRLTTNFRPTLDTRLIEYVNRIPSTHHSHSPWPMAIQCVRTNINIDCSRAGCLCVCLKLCLYQFEWFRVCVRFRVWNGVLSHYISAHSI